MVKEGDLSFRLAIIKISKLIKKTDFFPQFISVPPHFLIII